MRLPDARSCRFLAFVLLCCGCVAEPGRTDGIAWGTPVDGFVVALSLDKEVYRVSDPVHIHLACSRLTADWTEVSVNGSLCDAHVDVRGEDGDPAVPAPPGEPSNPDGSECLYVTAGRRSALVHVQQDVVLTEDRVQYRPLPAVGCSRAAVPENFFEHPGIYTATAMWRVPLRDRDFNILTRSRTVTVRVVAD